MPEPIAPLEATADKPSALSPFRHRVFAVVWTATLVSNIGIWMQNAASGWLMTSLSGDPRVVALVQVASALPMFLLGLPAGALSDLVDRRRLLIAMELVITALTTGFSFLAAADLVTPLVLVGFIFLSSAAGAAISPTWQAIVPELVPEQDLAPAVGLSSVSINISRAIGPALAGVMIGRLSMAAPFAVNAACNLVCVASLWWWRSKPAPAGNVPPEGFVNAIIVGVRHARHNAPLRSTLVRGSGFFLFASAYWALLPLLARDQLAGTGDTYGMLLGSIGVGAIFGAFILPRLKSRLKAESVVLAGSLGTAVAMLVFAWATRPALALAGAGLAGLSWIAVLATLNVSAQRALPDWVRGRGLAAHTTVSFGALTLGSVLWGQVGAFGLPLAHVLAATGLVASAFLLRRWRLRSGNAPDLTPSMYWPQPMLLDRVHDERGPVLVIVDYRIGPQDTEAFLKAVGELGASRQRNGAYRWGVFEDASEPGHWIETFLSESWPEYLRELERVTHADMALVKRVNSFHQGSEPRVSRFAA